MYADKYRQRMAGMDHKSILKIQEKRKIVDVNEIKWNSLIFDDKAALCYIITGEKILLIRKKKGLGAGKISGPGGRIEPGETEEQTAIRETHEEIGLVPENLKKMAELYFFFTSGYTLFCSIFTATGYTGTEVETDEAVPFWFSLSEIPYHEMWEDDNLWLPLVLSGKALRGYFVFDDEKMMSRKIIEVAGF